MPPNARSLPRRPAGDQRTRSPRIGTREAAPRTLYKYVPPERVDILENACVCFTRPDVFNDVFEMSPVWKSFADLNEFARLAPGALAEARKHANDREIEEELLSLNQQMLDQGTLAEWKHAVFPRILGGIGVLCLTEKPDNLLMWSHYADHHRGFLLEFDARHSFFDQRQAPDDEFHHVRKVRYTTDRPTTTAVGVVGPHTLLTKSLEWQYEQEWRMLVHFERFPHRVVSRDDQDVRLVSIPRSGITGVILGCRAQRKTVEVIADMVLNDHRYKHVTVRHASLHSEKFGLVFRSLGEHYLERGKEFVARARRLQELGLADKEFFKEQRLAEAAMKELDCAIRWAPCADAYIARGNARLLLDQQKDAAADFKHGWIMDPSTLVRMLESHPDWKDILPDAALVAPQKPPPPRKTPARSRPWETSEELVACVVRYWDLAGAAGLEVLSTIRVGDVLHVWGTQTDFVQQAKSIERKHLKVKEGLANTRIGLKVDHPVREGDEVYRVRLADLRRDREAALWIEHESRDAFVGIVQRCYATRNAVTVLILLGRLSKGDHIRIRGRNTDVRHRLEALRCDGKQVSKVDGTAVIELPVPGKVRIGDLVYRVSETRK